jgi:hypothetical protein
MATYWMKAKPTSRCNYWTRKSRRVRKVQWAYRRYNWECFYQSRSWISNLKKFYKNLTNRKFRRYEKLESRISHKKLIDLWWSVY